MHLFEPPAGARVAGTLVLGHGAGGGIEAGDVDGDHSLRADPEAVGHAVVGWLTQRFARPL